MRAFGRLMFAATLLGAAGLVFPQAPVYKLKQPDGRIIYSDSPHPNTKLEKDLTDAPVNVSPPAATAAEITAARQRQKAREAAEEAAAAKQRAPDPDAAAQARAGDPEPQPGERIGTKSGKSRLNDAYWDRQSGAPADAKPSQ